MRLIALSFLVLVPLNIVLANQYFSVSEALMDSVEEAYSHELIDDDIKDSRLPMFKEALELKLRDLNPKKNLWGSFVNWINTFIRPGEGVFTAEDCKIWSREDKENLRPINREGVSYFRLKDSHDFEDMIIAYEFKSMRLLAVSKEPKNTEYSAILFQYRNDGILADYLNRGSRMYFPLNFATHIRLNNYPLILMKIGVSNGLSLMGEFWTPLESEVMPPIFPFKKKGLRPFICKSGDGCYYTSRREKIYLTKSDRQYIDSGAFSPKRVAHLLKSCEFLRDEDMHHANNEFVNKVFSQCDINDTFKRIDLNAIRQQCEFAIDEIRRLTVLE